MFRLTSVLCSCIGFFITLVTFNTSAAPQLMGDINSAGNPGVGFSVLGSTVAVANGYYFFVADDGITGREPWAFDIATGEAVRLADITPGPATSGPGNFLALGSQVVFTASDPESGTELWISDGTPGGTHQVMDINPGPNSSTPLGLVAIGSSTVAFAATGPDFGRELWRTDGTGGGTSRVTDINPGEGSSSPSSLVVMGGFVYFSAANGDVGCELWRTNGTTTNLVKDIEPGPGSSSPAYLTTNGSEIFFRACTTDEGCELRRSDGTEAGTGLAADINSGTDSSSPSTFIWNSDLQILFFSADDGVVGAELWKMEMPSGTVSRVGNINPGAAASSPHSFLNLGSTVLFTAKDGASGTRLFSSDGTGVTEVKSLSNAGVTASIGSIVEFDGEAYFSHLSSCWRSDGTGAGTVIWESSCHSAPSLFGSGGRLYFGKRESAGPLQIWSVGPGAAGLQQETAVKGWSSDPKEFTQIGGLVFFSADDGVHGRELWVFDEDGGATTGLDLLSGASGSNPLGLTSFGGKVWFKAVSQTNGAELWFSDGTSAGSGFFDLVPGPQGLSPNELVVAGSKMFFSGDDDDADGRQVYRSDGTIDSTVALSVGESNASPEQLTPLGDRVFFFADTSATGTELWVVDGISSAPSVLEVEAGSGDTAPDNLVAWNGFVWFEADDIEGDGDRQIWRSDGTAPEQITHLAAASGSTDIDRLTAGADGVYFTYDDGLIGEEVWKTDGVTTVPVTDIAAGPDGSDPDDLVAVGDRVFFVGDDGINGSEIWWTDGVEVDGVDIVPGPDESSPQWLTAAGDSVFFVASTPESGEELWESDGILTRRVTDIWPGSGSSTPYYPAGSADGQWIYFSAVTENEWREPYRMGVWFFGDGFESGSTSAWSQTTP